MPRIDESTRCHFYDIDCYYPINEEDLKLLLEELEEGEILSQVPSMDSGICTNCLLSQVLDELHKINSKDADTILTRS